MSDDDLWRPKDPSAGDHPRADDRADAEESRPDESRPEGPSAQQPGNPAGDQTQPLHGTPGSAPAPPGPSYEPPPPGPGAVPPPRNPFGQQSPYGAPPPQNPYGAGQGQPWGQPGQQYAPPPNPYQAPHEYGAPQSPYGTPYQPAYAGALPNHPSSTTAMVLGIVGLVGVVLCGGLTLLLSPAAWIVGAKAVREMDASPGRYGGRDRAQAGKIMGIIGTVLLALAVVAIIAVVAVAVSVGDSDPSPAFPSPNSQSSLNG
jgi:hypothetical protein